MALAGSRAQTVQGPRDLTGLLVRLLEEIVALLILRLIDGVANIDLVAVEPFLDLTNVPVQAAIDRTEPLDTGRHHGDGGKWPGRHGDCDVVAFVHGNLVATVKRDKARCSRLLVDSDLELRAVRQDQRPERERVRANRRDQEHWRCRRQN